MILVVVAMILVMLMMLRQHFDTTFTNVTPALDTSYEFDVHVINLARSRKRMQDFMKMISGTDLANVSVIRFEAVDGNTLELTEHVTDQALQEILRAERLGYRQRHYELTRGGVGCFLSHVGVWKRLLKSDKQYIMVCEDDAVLSQDIGQATSSALSLPDIPQWDVLLLGHFCVHCKEYSSTWTRMKRFFGLHCYLIRREAVTKIMSYYTGRIEQQIDSMMSDMCSEGRLNVFGVTTQLASQVGRDTNIQMPLQKRSTTDAWKTLPAVQALRSQENI